MGAFGSFTVSLFIILLCERSYEEICAAKVEADHELIMNVISKRNDTGEWVSTFTAEKKSKKNSSVIDVDVSFKSFDCNRRQTVLIRGVLKETMKKGEERLLFHPNCGTNIAIVKGGRSIVKLNNLDGNDIAMTKRPLKDDELFEVRLDKKVSKEYYSMGIGVTTHDPHNMVLPRHMSNLKTGTWMFFHTDLYSNGSLLRDKYTPNIDKLETCGSVTAMIKSLGWNSLLERRSDYRKKLFEKYIGPEFLDEVKDIVTPVNKERGLREATTKRYTEIIAKTDSYFWSFFPNSIRESNMPGERLGVKRTEFGTLHLLINGVDQGPAASRVPAGVFGVYQLHGNAVEATIVDAS